jgi:HprK-related kinase A
MLHELSKQEVQAELRGPGIRLRVGPFGVTIRSDDALLASTLHSLYADFPLLPENEPSDFRMRLVRPLGLRRWWRPQVRFLLDDAQPFEAFSSRLAIPLFEWGFNWCIYEHAHEFLIIHASVVERGGRALIMAAPPGSGKSTLCAALAHRGWRLLSDEFALIRKTDGRVVPIPRPIGLKEKSIELIRGLAPLAEFGPVFADTRKGNVAHVRPPTDAVARATETAVAAWLVFPRYEAGVCAAFQSLGKASAFVKASSNCFNYDLQRETGYALLSLIVEQCACFDLHFANLDQVLELLDPLVAGTAP